MGFLLNKFTDLSQLTKTETNILMRIDSEPELLGKLTLTELASAVSASNTSIIRLTKKLGYSGFSEFKFDMNQAIHTKNTNKSDLLAELQNFSERFLAENIAKNLDFFVSCILKSKNVYIAGVGSSKILAEYFAHRLLQFDHPAVCIYDNSLLDLLPNIVNRQSLIIYISVSGETLRLVNSAKKVKQTGATLLSITNNPASTLAHLSEKNIATQAKNSFHHNYDITARTLQMAIIDLILEYYLKYIHSNN